MRANSSPGSSGGRLEIFREEAIRLDLKPEHDAAHEYGEGRYLLLIDRSAKGGIGVLSLIT